MKSTILVGATLLLLGSAGPFGLIAQAAGNEKKPALRVPPRLPFNAGVSPGASTRAKPHLNTTRDLNTLAPRARPPGVGLRPGPAKKSVADLVATPAKVEPPKPETTFVVADAKTAPGSRLPSSPRYRMNASTSLPAAEVWPFSTGVKLQGLVRYFQTGRPLVSDAGASVEFRPPVHDADLLKILEPPAQRR